MEHAHGGDREGGAASKRRKVEGKAERSVAKSGAGAGGGRDEGSGTSAACLRMREKILAVERDYTHYFALDVGGEPGADQYVYQHFNTLCMVGIAPSSIALAGGRKVTQVDFDVGRGGDKSDAPKPSGKKKKGAMYVALCCACGCISLSAAVEDQRRLICFSTRLRAAYVRNGGQISVGDVAAVRPCLRRWNPR